MDNGLPPRDSDLAEDKQAIARASYRVVGKQAIARGSCRVAGKRAIAPQDRVISGRGKRVIERANSPVGDRPAIGLAVVLAGDRRKAISIGS